MLVRIVVLDGRVQSRSIAFSIRLIHGDSMKSRLSLMIVFHRVQYWFDDDDDEIRSKSWLLSLMVVFHRVQYWFDDDGIGYSSWLLSLMIVFNCVQYWFD